MRTLNVISAYALPIGLDAEAKTNFLSRYGYLGSSDSKQTYDGFEHVKLSMGDTVMVLGVMKEEFTLAYGLV